MNCMQRLDSLLEALTSTPYTARRYSGEIEWLRLRKEKWSESRVRIGVVGVTSSGKSTLINAILGDELLSTAVRPTSGQLVTCAKGPRPRARILFEDGRPPLELEGAGLTLDRLRRYSDERLNRQNHERVAEIQLCAPRFDLGDGVALVDSAGLDAYKLERHERLTLDVLLPTLDLCLLVTSMKPGSDDKLRATLNSIADHRCPLLIVQNMLDSVEPSADGLKSRQMVAQEYRRRLERAAELSRLPERGGVRIVQMSALHAMRERCGGKTPGAFPSRYPELCRAVRAMVESFLPRIDHDRCESVRAHMDALVRQEKRNLSSASPAAPVFEFHDTLPAMEEMRDNAMRQIETILRSMAATDFTGLFSLGDTRLSAQEKLDRVKAEFEDSGARIESVMRGCERALADCAQRLSIPVRDLARFSGDGGGPRAPVAASRTVVRPGWVEKGGPLGGVARACGGVLGTRWGYQCAAVPRSEFDPGQTRRELRVYLGRAAQYYRSGLRAWERGLDRSLAALREEADAQRASFESLRARIREEDAVRSALARVESLMRAWSPADARLSARPAQSQRRIAALKPPGDAEGEAESVSLPRYQAGALGLSRRYRQALFSQTLTLCRRIIGAPEEGIVLGWDLQSMEDFLFRFWNLALDEEGRRRLGSGEPLGSGPVRLSLSPTPEAAAAALGGGAERGALSVYILVGALQDGSVKNSLSRLGLNGSLRAGDRVFWVTQDLRGLIECAGIQEMKFNLSDYYREFRLEERRGCILLCDDNPIYNLAYVQAQLEPCSGQREETQLLRELRERFSILFEDGVTERVLGELIRKN